GAPPAAPPVAGVLTIQWHGTRACGRIPGSDGGSWLRFLDGRKRNDGQQPLLLQRRDQPGLEVETVAGLQQRTVQRLRGEQRAGENGLGGRNRLHARRPALARDERRFAAAGGVGRPHRRETVVT